MESDILVVDRHKSLDSSRGVWARWLVLFLALCAWVGVMEAFPMYFQRDEAHMIYWTKHHGLFDGFIPDYEHGLAHDGSYRPLLYLYWSVMYSIFGMNFVAHYLMTGVLFITGMTLLYKLVKDISGSAQAWLSIVIWLASFQFLMTVLFWITDQGYLLMLILVLAGMNLVVKSIGCSLLKTVIGLLLMLSTVLIWEPLALVCGSAAAVHVLIRGPQMKWSGLRILGLVIVCFAVAPAYWLLMPFSLNRISSASSSTALTVSDIISRLSYYGGHLTSGATGLILLIPAFYFIVRRVTQRWSDKTWSEPISMILAGALSVVIGTCGLQVVGMAGLVAAAFLLPRSTWFLIPVAFLPILGLMAFPISNRTYLFVPTYALTVFAAIETCGMGRNAAEWWKRVVGKRTLGIAILIVLAIAECAVVAHKATSRVALLRLRSDMNANIKSVTPNLRRLPAGATVVTIDYASMGIDFLADMNKWDDREKLLYQAPIDSASAAYWYHDVGRDDLRSMTYSDYKRQRILCKVTSPVYIWLQTAKDHEFFAVQGVKTTVVASIVHGQARTSLLLVK